MVIGIDGNEANVNKKVGIGEFASELLKQFSGSKFKVCSPLEAGSSKFEIYLKNKPNEGLPREREGWKYKIVKPSKLWTQIGLPLSLYFQKPRPNIFFSPTHYAPRFCPVPTVISIMDLSYLHYPQMFKKRDLYQLRNWTLHSAKKAAKIITISESSKNDIIKNYKVEKDKVVVVYPGIKEVSSIKYQVSSMDKIKEKYSIKGDYILFVGTIQPRKNIKRLIEAFAKIINEEKKDLSLVIIGKKGWLYEEILDTPKKLQIEEEVKFLDFVPDEDLPSFYAHAKCFVLPSLYEGFGLPVLEAMKYGCPVLASNVSSLPEAGGDAAVYFDPFDVDDIKEKILEVLNKEKLRKEMTEKGYKQVKKFSWEKSAEQVLGVLEEVAKDKL